MKEKSEKEQSLKLFFVIVGLIEVLVGIVLQVLNWPSSTGFLMLGFGIVFLGYSFNPGYFLAKLGENKKIMTKPARIISLLGFSVIFVGGLIEFF